MNPAPLDTAREAWGADLPDWIETLAVECGRTSQNKVAAQLCRSAAVISQVLRHKYPASMDGIEERVRGVFLNARVACPAFGEIAANECQDWREKSREFAPGNPVRVRMFRACNACPRNKAKESEE